jgi:hypothetical protein
MRSPRVLCAGVVGAVVVLFATAVPAGATTAATAGECLATLTVRPTLGTPSPTASVAIVSTSCTIVGDTGGFSASGLIGGAWMCDGGVLEGGMGVTAGTHFASTTATVENGATVVNVNATTMTGTLAFSGTFVPSGVSTCPTTWTGEVTFEDPVVDTP